MENEHMENPELEQEQPVYTPRPKWQICLAWLGVGIVAVGFILYLIHIASAGQI